MSKTIGATKQIYNHLGDDLSKTIFENRLLYSVTEEYKFINNIIKTFPEFELQRRHLINSFFSQQNRKIIGYGLGGVCLSFIELCNEIEITALCDGDKSKQNITYSNYNTISPETLKDKFPDSYVVITTLSDKNNSDIFNKLVNMGFSKSQLLVFKDFLISNGTTLFSQYFDPDIVNPVTQDEVFIDAGCYNGNDVISFTKWCNDAYKKIIAFEPSSVQYPTCMDNLKGINNLDIYPFGLWNENSELNFKESGPVSSITEGIKENFVRIKTKKLDDVLNGETATFIKMDIEGAELKALMGAERTILRNRPKLAISVYHKAEDIWEIPGYILSLYNDYQIYFRHYSFFGSETVLYAV